MEEPIKNQNVQTYVSDMTKALEGNKEGLIQKIIHEQERAEAEKKLSPESKKSRFFIIGGILLLILSLAALASFTAFQKKTETVEVAPQFKPLIFTDKTFFQEVAGFSKESIIESILAEVRNTKVKAGGVEGIYLTENKQAIGLRRFIALTKSKFVPSEAPFVEDGFLLGIVNQGMTADNQANGGLFILLKARSFEDIFPSMRAWENKMLFDIGGFFSIDTAGERNYLLTKNFEEGIIGNKNSRILYDNEHNIVLMYIFADDHSVIIANSEAVAGEVMLRLKSAEIKK